MKHVWRVTHGCHMTYGEPAKGKKVSEAKPSIKQVD
jgi:hypothetical protein